MVFEKVYFIKYKDGTQQSVTREFFNVAHMNGRAIVNVVTASNLRGQPVNYDTLFLTISAEQFEALFNKMKSSRSSTLDLTGYQS